MSRKNSGIFAVFTDEIVYTFESRWEGRLFSERKVSRDQNVSCGRSVKNRRTAFQRRPHDPMDLNGDGKITLADVKLLKVHCTYPNCSVPATAALSSITPPVLHSAPGAQGGPVSITWNAVTGAADYLVFRITASGDQQVPPPAGPTACAAPNAPTICTMLPAPEATSTTTPLFGYPSAPELMGRVTSPAYGETAPNTLQTLYFVVAEDSQGNLSKPSNVVGGPSLAAQ